MSDLPIDQKAREVAGWLGWGAFGNPFSGHIALGPNPELPYNLFNLEQDAISTLHAACLRERLLLSIAEAAEKYREVCEGRIDPPVEDYAEYFKRVDEKQHALDTALSAWREGKGTR